MDNRAADALSRKPHLDDQLLAISSHQPAWIQEILDVYQENIEAQDLLVKLAVQIFVFYGIFFQHFRVNVDLTMLVI